jgi:hypothetical protein
MPYSGAGAHVVLNFSSNGEAANGLEQDIHFALGCASSSCPPIEVYTPEK